MNTDEHFNISFLKKKGEKQERLKLKFMVLSEFPIFLYRKDIHMHKQKTLFYLILYMDCLVCTDF